MRFIDSRLGLTLVAATLCIVAMACLILILYSRESRRVAIRRDALEHLESKGGIYVYDYMNGEDIDSVEPLSGPWINRKLFGELSTQAVERIQFHIGPNDASEFDESEMKAILDPFREELVQLSLDNTNADDEMLSYLKGFSCLRNLTLCNTQITLQAVQEFAQARKDVFIVHPAMNDETTAYCGSER